MIKKICYSVNLINSLRAGFLKWTIHDDDLEQTIFVNSRSNAEESKLLAPLGSCIFMFKEWIYTYEINTMFTYLGRYLPI